MVDHYGRPRSLNFTLPEHMRSALARPMGYSAADMGRTPGTPVFYGARGCGCGAGQTPTVHAIEPSRPVVGAIAAPPAPPPPPASPPPSRMIAGQWVYPAQDSLGRWYYPPVAGGPAAPVATTSDAPIGYVSPAPTPEPTMTALVATEPPPIAAPEPVAPPEPGPIVTIAAEPPVTAESFVPVQPAAPPAEAPPPPWYKSTAFKVGASAAAIVLVGAGVWYVNAGKRRRR